MEAKKLSGYEGQFVVSQKILDEYAEMRETLQKLYRVAVFKQKNAHEKVRNEFEYFIDETRKWAAENKTGDDGK